MERIILLLLLCTTIESLVVKKYYLIRRKTDWYSAQAYCRQHYTDLSFIERDKDQEDIRIAGGGSFIGGWIGLNRDVDDVTSWKWSGGGPLRYTRWEHAGPDPFGNLTHGAITSNGYWYDFSMDFTGYFYCVHLTMEQSVKKSWEESVEHCRANRSDLISRPSETEILHTQRLMLNVSTDRVWVGLRYLGDGWLWLSGEPVEDRAWSADQQCPEKNGCGALNKEGQLEVRDCEERLNFFCY